MDTEAEVVKDILARQRRGVSKYGVTVANNPLPLQDWLHRELAARGMATQKYLRAAARIDQQIARRKDHP
jgi:hypothetical protein